MNAPETILAIDQSTSATKSIVFDTRGNALDRFAIEHAPIYPQSGFVEHDAEELWRNTQSVIRQAIARYPSTACLSISNQRETFVIFDRVSGKPLHNAVVWQCRRGDEICARLIRDGKADLVSRKTGLKIDSYFSASKLTALLQENPGLRQKLNSGEALFGTIDTYLLYRLTAGRVYATDSTNACRTLLYNINTLAWDAELCELFDVPINALPEVRDSAAVFGHCDAGAVGVTIPIAGIMGDSQAALFAHGCFDPGDAKVTIGTGSSVLLNTGADCPASGVRTLARTHNGVPTYCLEGIVSYSAATITWLRDKLGLIQSAGETEAAARAVTDNGGVYLVPAFVGLSAPHWSPDARAAIVGLSAASSRNHIIRAALEAIVYQIKDALDSMRSQIDRPLNCLRVDGGASSNTFVTQFLADITGTTITVADSSDFSPRGAAFLGMLGLGIHTSLDQLRTLGGEHTVFTPQMPRNIADALCAGWQTAVRQVLAGTENGSSSEANRASSQH
ncbi:MAG: glycerol kinase GlpK [Burkholderiales bacterium]|nr:glycerol kinase GlpK [Phycisphaerae bacterium]